MTGSNRADSRAENKDSVLAGITSFFTSVKTTIVVLCILAVSSILGTVIPQNVDMQQLQQTASPFYYRIVVILDLTDVYHSWWFTLLLLLLTANLIGCMLQRLPRIPGEWKGASEKGSIRFSLSDPRKPGELKDILTTGVGKLLGSPSLVRVGNDEINLAWVKQRVFLFAFPLIHLGIITILLGGMIGLFYSVQGNIRIREGDVGQKFVRFPSRDIDSLPFQVAVDKFTLERYPTGQPKSFRSDVRLIKDGKEVKKGSILVNKPMTYEGISLYQANYELLGVRQVNFRIINQDGKESDFVVKPPATAQLPGTRYTVELVSVDPGSTKRGAGTEMTVAEPGQPIKRLQVFRNDTEPAKLGDLAIRFVNYEPLYATGLQIGYDPGTNLVWVGSGLLVLGFCLTLFTNLRGVAIQLKHQAGKTEIRVTGRSRRDRAEFRKKIEATVRESLKA